MLTGISVLVIDDEKDARDLVRVILEERGASVRTAASAADGREQIAKSPPQIIVCDIGLPQEDGYDFIAEIKGRNIATPIVALTAFARPEDRVRSIKAGFAGHLAKPVEPAELLVTIASLVGLYFA